MAASGNNKFGLTCAQVRQFMMERNRQVRMGDLVGSSSFQRPLQLTPVPVATGPAGTWDTGATTLSLFPAGTGTEIIRPEETKATLTIFYQGQVATFHDFPADRAKDLLQMAGSVTGKAPEKGFLQMAGSVTVKSPEKVVMTAVPEKAETSDEPSAAGAGMQPIARKLTLQRFLRKRKNRNAGTDDPDHNEDASPWKKRDSAGAGNNPAEDVPDDASWLRL
ncbi:unnamed protein product [Miscanthus lutarioriparius]|uniref:Protein TIFY n=1 Tax=Miscanthus lutarioriparius TaxID=422564 RepID=A0A811MWY9_9POAL|nr:unnamed protein product [Miscanthus lutarioriparius]